MARRIRPNSRMRIKVEGVNDIIAAMREADSEIQRELRDLVAEAAEIVFRAADANVPILSGKARATLEIEIGENKKGQYYASVVVGSKSGSSPGTPFYITFYELGTSRQEPRPFMRPALDKNKAKIRKHIVEGLKAIIARQGV